MKVYLPEINFDSPLSCDKVLNCIISEKVDDGYIIDILGQEVFAKSDLDLKPNDHIKVKVVESSPEQLILKVIPGIKTSDKLNITNSTDPKIQLPITILSKLNLSMTDDRLKLVSEILSSLFKHESISCFTEAKGELESIQQFLEIIRNFEQLLKLIFKDTNENAALKHVTTLKMMENSASSDTDSINPIVEEFLLKKSKKYMKNEGFMEKILKTLSDKGIITKKNSSFEKLITNYIKTKIIPKSSDKIEKLKEKILVKLKNNIENQSLTFKKAIAVRILNTAHDDKVRFYFLPLLPNSSIYIKISKNKSNGKKETKINESNDLNLSILLETYNLGKILINFIHKKDHIFPHLTFENKKSLEYVKNASSSSTDPFINSIRFSLKKISVKDFFFQYIENDRIPNRVNIKI